MEIKKIDFLAIGDIAVDAIIKIKDAHVNCRLNTNNCELCFSFGDKIPYESVNVIFGVGNSSNASICASRLGLSSTLISNLGDDENGLECLKTLENEKVNTEYITKQKDKKTNYHYVLWYDKERTILVKHTEYEFNFPEIKDAEVSWIYLSSTSVNSISYYEKIIKFLKNNPNTKLAFQPGTSQIKLGKEKLKEIYENTNTFFCNKEEAERILEMKNKSILELSKEIANLGPKMVFITDGKNGAYYYENEELYHLPVFYNENPVLEITGAGDAFSATVVSEMAKGKNPKDAFLLGPINAMSTVRQIGPHKGLLNNVQIDEFLKNAKEDYKLQKIN